MKDETKNKTNKKTNKESKRNNNNYEKVKLSDEQLFNEYNKEVNDLINKNNEEEIKKLEELISNSIKTAYWNGIKEEIFEGESKTFNILLLEIREKIFRCIGNNENFKLFFDEYFDIKYYTNLINNKVFTETDFKNIVKYFNNIISKIQSPADDEILKKFEEDINKKIEEDLFINCIEDMIEFYNHHLDKIYKNKIDYLKKTKKII